MGLKNSYKDQGIRPMSTCADGWIFDKDADLESSFVFRCRPVSIFPNIDTPQGFLCEQCQLDSLLKLPTPATEDSIDISVPIEKEFENPVYCAWCGVLIQFKTGFTRDGISHGMCETCFEKNWSFKTE